MAGIDDLNQNDTIIDLTGSFNESTENNNRRHNFSRPDYNSRVVTKDTVSNENDRVEVDLTKAAPQKQPEDIRESYIKDILDGDNSVFARYKADKVAEFNERMATYEDEKAIEEENEVSNENDGSFFGVESVESDKEEDSDEQFTTIANESLRSSEIETVNIVEEDATVFKAVEENPVSIFKEEVAPAPKAEKVEIESPDIDLDVTSVENTNKIEDEVVEDDESQNEVDEDEILNNLKKLAIEKLKPVSKSLDLSSFTILKKPTANISSLNTAQVKAAKWVLEQQESVVLMKEFLGSELEFLRENSEDGNSITQLYRRFRCIYDHIVSKKPDTYEAWLKSTPYSDIDHYFFAAYIASFKGANFIPLDCQNKKCGQTFLTDDIPIMKMVKFNTEEAKKKFTSIYESEAMPAGKGIYCSEIVPLNDKLAIGFKDASIYNLFEIASLSDQDKDKYSTIIEFIPYIESLYKIDLVNQNLEPIGYKVYPDNTNKTVKSKVKKYFDTLKTLTIDEFGQIKPYISSIISRKTGMSYVYPSVDCPHCGTATREIATTAQELLFTRYQISALVNTSLK